jgi:hypothetical protein
MKYLAKLRRWLIIKLANGRPIALNLKLTRGLYFQHGQDGGWMQNIQIDLDAEWPIGPDKVGFYFSGDPSNKDAYHTYPKD